MYRSANLFQTWLVGINFLCVLFRIFLEKQFEWPKRDFTEKKTLERNPHFVDALSFSLGGVGVVVVYVFVCFRGRRRRRKGTPPPPKKTREKKKTEKKNFFRDEAERKKRL